MPNRVSSLQAHISGREVAVELTENMPSRVLGKMVCEKVSVSLEASSDRTLPEESAGEAAGFRIYLMALLCIT